jgi:proteasome activator subunit 4
MKTLRYIKLRTFSQSNEDIAIQMNRNPLRKILPVQDPTSERTQFYLSQFKEPVDWKQASKQPYLTSLCNVVGD